MTGGHISSFTDKARDVVPCKNNFFIANNPFFKVKYIIVDQGERTIQNINKINSKGNVNYSK